MNFREWVPDSARFWLYICFLAVFQFSNGFYFTTMAQVVGERNVTMNDAHMFGQAVLIGLTFYFPLAFRLKFRFTNRTSLTVAATGLALINAVFPFVHSYPLLLLLCYAGGFFRLYGTFECFSNLLPKLRLPIIMRCSFFRVLRGVRLHPCVRLGGHPVHLLLRLDVYPFALRCFVPFDHCRGEHYHAAFPAHAPHASVWYRWIGDGNVEHLYPDGDLRGAVR